MKPKTLVLIGGILLMVGAATPWAVMSAGLLGLSRSINGLDTDGIFTGLGGFVLLLIAIFAKEKPGKMFSPIGVFISLICGAVIVLKMFSINAIETESIDVSLGFGLQCLSPLGMLLSLIGTIKMIPAEAAQPAPVTPPATTP